MTRKNTDSDFQPPMGGVGGFPDEFSISDDGDRYILKLGEITDSDRERIRNAGLEIVHDLEAIGFVIVRGDESVVEDTGYEYMTDFTLQADGDTSGR